MTLTSSLLSVLFTLSCTLLLHGQSTRKRDLVVHDSAIHCLVVGDWGQANKRQHQVAAAMAKVAQQTHADFIISTGDNFYPSGVGSVHDSSWKVAFEDVYYEKSLMIPWYPVLGNHDYGGDADAQVEYSEVSTRWSMPSLFYRKTFPLKNDSVSKVTFLFIDTTPLVSGNYGPDHVVNRKNNGEQLKWIEEQLSNIHQDIRWTFVVGHHPVYTAGQRRDNLETLEIGRVLKPLFMRFHVDAYLSGHEHNLQHIEGKNGLQQFVSGGGSEGRLTKPFVSRRFTRAATGFILFSVMKTGTLVQFINRKGNVIYRYTIVPKE